MKLFLVLFNIFHFSSSDWVKEMENPDLFQGDILLSPEQQSNMKAGKYPFALTKKNFWPKQIAYAIDKGLEGYPAALRSIQEAIDDYERYTCLRFVKRTTEYSYMWFYNSGQGCFSAVGKQGGKQGISLSSGCWYKGVAIHEMMHALGKKCYDVKSTRLRIV